MIQVVSLLLPFIYLVQTMPETILLQSVVSACQSDGPMMIGGDFNVNVKAADRNYRNELFDNILDANSLLALSQTLFCQGPDYTFFTNTQNSTLDYILTDVDFYDNALNCIVHPHESSTKSF